MLQWFLELVYGVAFKRFEFFRFGSPIGKMLQEFSDVNRKWIWYDKKNCTIFLDMYGRLGSKFQAWCQNSMENSTFIGSRRNLDLMYWTHLGHNTRFRWAVFDWWYWHITSNLLIPNRIVSWPRYIPTYPKQSYMTRKLCAGSERTIKFDATHRTHELQPQSKLSNGTSTQSSYTSKND